MRLMLYSYMLYSFLGDSTRVFEQLKVIINAQKLFLGVLKIRPKILNTPVHGALRNIRRGVIRKMILEPKKSFQSSIIIFYSFFNSFRYLVLPYSDIKTFYEAIN